MGCPADEAGTPGVCNPRGPGCIICWGAIYPPGAPGGGKVTVTPSTQYTAVSVGTSASCGIKATGNLACWGTTDEWQAMTDPILAVAVGGVGGSGTGSVHGCALKAVDACPACWGSDLKGQASPPSC